MSGNNMWLAQLAQDMQDPEIMNSANDMMQSAEFQAQMARMTQHPGFQQAIKATQQLMQDPEKVKQMQAKMEKSIGEGTSQLEAARAAAKEVATEQVNAEKKVKGDDDSEKKSAASLQQKK